MEAPEKLYLISDEDDVILSYDPLAKLKFGNRYDFVDKEVFPIEEGSEIEYIRKDAFIEKVINFLNYKLDDVVNVRVPGTIIPHHVAKQEVIDELRNHLKG